MEFRPSGPQALCVAARISGASVAGTSAAPLTPVHTANDCATTCSISVSRPLAVWFWVKTVTGLEFSAVLHRTAMLPIASSWCARTGQDDPPEIDAGCRTSGTIMSKE